MCESVTGSNDIVPVSGAFSADTGKYSEPKAVLFEHRSRRAKFCMGTARQIVGRRDRKRDLRRAWPLALRQSVRTPDRDAQELLLPPSRAAALAIHVRG